MLLHSLPHLCVQVLGQASCKLAQAVHLRIHPVRFFKVENKDLGFCFRDLNTRKKWLFIIANKARAKGDK